MRLISKNIILFFLFSFCVILSGAQNKMVTIQSDVSLDTLVNRNIENNKAANGIPGFRIQLYFGSERKSAHDAKEKFQQKHPGYDTYLIYQQPYFKVRVGDFRTKLEAQPLLKKVLPEFERVFIVPDKINLPKL